MDHAKLTFHQYFSSLERLRLAQDAGRSSSTSKVRPQSARRPSISHLTSLRKPSTSSSESTDRSFSVGSLHRARSKSRLRKWSQPAISPSTTLINPWDFAALPAAIQRKHFTPEEQYHIASQLNVVILDAADKALYRQHQQAALRESRSLDLNRDTPVEAFLEEDDADGAEEDMEARDYESFRFLDQDTSLDLKLDDYHAINAEVQRPSTATPQRRSFRRGLSFSNVSFRRRSSSSMSIHSPPALGSPTKLQVPPPMLLQPRHQSKSSTASLDPSATHYQDPTAKMKLRVYLASPQKFDEALEFGFPSLHKNGMPSPERPKTSAGVVGGQPKTSFFVDDTPSLSEDERSEYLGHDSPRTPIEMSFPPHRSSQKSSTDRSMSLRPRVIHNIAESYTHAPATDREMTLKMTLTRPELRQIEDSEQMQPVNETPLEKVPLTIPMNATTSIWDELPEDTSRMRRFFRKLKGRA